MDVNECLSNPCTETGKFCANTPGNFTCRSCNVACNRDKGCTGPDNSDCNECNHGYRQQADSSTCVDIDECAEGIKVCQPGQFCENGPGWSSCRACDAACGDEGCTGSGAGKCIACAPSFEMKDGTCVSREKEADDEDNKKDEL